MVVSVICSNAGVGSGKSSVVVVVDVVEVVVVVDERSVLATLDITAWSESHSLWRIGSKAGF
jgi:hypothetical protein